MTLPLFPRGARGSREPAEPERVYRVSELNRLVRLELEANHGDVWIEGELADVKKAATGHVYFTLCDESEGAQLKAVMFRSDAQRARAKLLNGQRVRMRGSLTLYEPRGSFQFVARLAIPAGEGDLAAAFERIRKLLEAEGLFDPARKRPLPMLPRTVGVVTSRAGAAMHDIVRVARGRCPVRIVVADCRVQGDEAPASIVRALHLVQRLPELDVVIVARGGGSAEELWAFNDEGVARAIASCRVPTISGVGHETDVTIADFAADVRASTPSNAAELAVPDRRALEASVSGLTRRLERSLEMRLGRERLRVERFMQRLPDPRRRLARQRTLLDGERAELVRNLRRVLVRDRRRLEAVQAKLARLDPRAVLSRGRKRLADLEGRLVRAMRMTNARDRRTWIERATHLRALGLPIVEKRRGNLVAIAGRLTALSPLAVLARGYAIALHEPTGKALCRAEEVEVGERLTVRLFRGSVSARVETRDLGTPSEDEERTS